MISFESFFIYNFILYLCVFLSLVYRYTRLKISSILLIFLLLNLFIGLRYFVGNDYQNYSDIFNWVNNYGLGTRTEIGYEFLNKLFGSFNDGIVLVMLSCSIITFIFLFWSFINHSIVTSGIFFIFVTEYALLMTDQVRQGIIIAAFIFSLKYIINREYLKYAIIIILISILFHYSGLVLLGLIFLRNIKLNNIIWVTLIIVSYVISITKVLDWLFYYLLQFIPVYGDKYLVLQNSRFLEAQEFDGTGLGILFKLFVFIYVGLFADQKRLGDYNVLYTVFMISGVLYFLFLDYFIALRLVSYFVYISIILFPILVSKVWKLKYSAPFVCAHIAYFSALTALEAGRYGGFPYKNYLINFIF